MGLYDGKVGGRGFASTAHVASLTRSPVVLVVDISRSSRSIGAVVHGMATYSPDTRIAGVILNKAGSPRHAAEVADSIDLPVLGTLGRDDRLAVPSRHLGLVPAAERDEAAHALDPLAEVVAEPVDLERVLDVAGRRPTWWTSRGTRRARSRRARPAWAPALPMVPGFRGSGAERPRTSTNDQRAGRPRTSTNDRRAGRPRTSANDRRSSRWRAAGRSRSATPRPRSCSAPPAATWCRSTR